MLYHDQCVTPPPPNNTYNLFKVARQKHVPQEKTSALK